MIVINNTGKNDNINLNNENSGILRYKLKKWQYDNNNNNNNNNNISSVNKNQIYSTYPMFIYVELAFGGHCLHFQVYTINSVIYIYKKKKRLQDILIFH